MCHAAFHYFRGALLYSFGYGMNFTKFSYSRLRLSHPKLRPGETLTVEV